MSRSLRTTAMVSAGSGTVALTLAIAVSWPLSYCLAIGATAAGLTALARQFAAIDTEKPGDFEAHPASGLRPSIATTAGAFRANDLTGSVRDRLIAVLADARAHAGLTEVDMQEKFGPAYTRVTTPGARVTPADAHHLLTSLTIEGHRT
ncbi:MAG: hypothetical protein Q4P36_06785 [Bowdeniella nasicola]|nr:hypothetical protein [Bowdeniella nasicola]